MSDGIVNIHGKDYQTVAKRIADYRGVFPSHTIETEIISAADLVQVKCSVSDGNKLLSTGHAEEKRDSTNINKTSALENCETSAVGRALAFVGYGGEQIASANEVSDAIIKQAKDEVASYFIRHNECVRNNMQSILAIKDALKDDQWSTAAECYMEMSPEDHKILWLAPTKGGMFTTEERAKLQQSEFTQEMVK